MFEIKHLKTLATLAETGNIRKTADLLLSSQSALSHQIKELEKRLNASLFIRNTSPVEFTDTGKVLLNLANDILPVITTANNALKMPKEEGITLKLAVACHACFQWLLPITTRFSEKKIGEKVHVEFIDDSFLTLKSEHQTDKKFAINEQVDILFTDEKVAHDNYIYQEIGQFEVVAVLSIQEAKNVNNNKYITADEFRPLTLLTYPVSNEQLDIFKLFLTPAKIIPHKIKHVNNSHVMLQMVAANMGVATLPDWLVSSLTQQSLVKSKPLGKQGIYKTLYARYHETSNQPSSKEMKRLSIIESLLPQTIQAFAALYVNNTKD